ncbi:MAG TPA: FeS-binding protein [Cyanobacteria bacterium UBA11372]|nr:FeS-binding protein [Cyanobacteria bacterium UBA11372]
MNAQHILFVCKTCATVWKDGKPQGKSGGQELIENLSQLHQNWELRDRFLLQEVECMSACSHSCAVSFAAPDKYTYLFGDLPPQNSAAAVLECAAQYYAKPNGLLPWAERPEPLKKGVIARIPPLK